MNNKYIIKFKARLSVVCTFYKYILCVYRMYQTNKCTSVKYFVTCRYSPPTRFAAFCCHHHQCAVLKYTQYTNHYTKCVIL